MVIEAIKIDYINKKPICFIFIYLKVRSDRERETDGQTERYPPLAGSFLKCPQ